MDQAAGPELLDEQDGVQRRIVGQHATDLADGVDVARDDIRPAAFKQAMAEGEALQLAPSLSDGFARLPVDIVERTGAGRQAFFHRRRLVSAGNRPSR